MKARQSVYEAKARFSSLLNEVKEKNCTIVICRHGVPVADLVGAKYLCDPTAPLEKDDWPEALR
jgi:prevent-host-death family protein